MVITLKAARINAGPTQSEVAKVIGKSVGTVSFYEAGKTIPKWDTLSKMADLYGVSIDSLVRPVEIVAKQT